MRGKPVLISAATMTSFWPWLRAKFGFQDSQIRKYTYNLAPFIVDPNAIQEGYLTSEPFTVQQQAHFTPKIFLLVRLRLSRLRQHGAGAAEMDRHQSQGGAGLRQCQPRRLAELPERNPVKANALIKRDNPDMTDAIIAQSHRQDETLRAGDQRRWPRLRPGQHDRCAVETFLSHHGVRGALSQRPGL